MAETIDQASPKTTDGISINLVRCPACGTPLPAKESTPAAVKCPSCSALYPADSEIGRRLSAKQDSSHPPRSFIRLGMSATLMQRKYYVLGRRCITTRMKEWDPEDKTYTNESWSYDEWLLGREDGGFIFLCEDSEGYEISYKFLPDNPEVPADHRRTLALVKGQRQRRLQEFGTARVVYHEGEFPWAVEDGDTGNYASYNYGTESFEVEWSLDSKGEIEEVEFYRNSKISYIELLEAFDQQELLARALAEEARKKEIKLFSFAFFGTAAILALLGFWAALSGSGRDVFSRSASIEGIPEEGINAGPFSLRRPGAIYRINTSISIPDNTYSWIGLELLNSEQQSINAIEGDFWRESGYDDEGHWSESFTSTNLHFKLKEPGEYYLRIFSERGTAPSGVVQINIREGVILARYFFIAALIALALGASVLRSGSFNPVFMAVGLLSLIFLILQRVGDNDD